MNRNSSYNFALEPSVKQPRSRFHSPFRNRTSFNFGQLVPICRPIEILPGDTLDLDLSSVIRMPALVAPPFDNAYMDVYAFFIPNRLTWEHAKEFFGENSSSSWIPEVEYSTPMIEAPVNGWNVGTLADYFGIPVGVDNFEVSALQARAYGLVVNEFFRSTVVDDPVNIPVTDSDQSGSNGSNYITDIVNLGMPFIANKSHDRFTSALIGPQRGPNTLIPIGNISTTGSGTGEIGSFQAPVFGNGYGLGFTDGTNLLSSVNSTTGQARAYTDNYFCLANFGDLLGSPYIDNGDLFNSVRGVTGVPTKAQLAEHPEYSGLVADVAGGPVDVDLTLSTNVTAGTISELRTAFQIQKFYERLALGGDRYREICLSMFSVQSPDARMQIPEYLGGSRFEISIEQSVQSSETSVTPQGNVAGYSHTADISRGIVHKSFTEHGYVLILGVARYKHSYCQGLEKQWTRKDKFDFYWPLFQNLSEEPIYNREIFLQGSDVINEDTGKAYDDEVFGYQERYAEYRTFPDMVTGLMRPNVSNNLGIWNFADNYESLPYLSSDWLKEDAGNISRIFAVEDMSTTHQLFGDFNFVINFTRCMPVRSMPGFIDHH